MREIQILNTPKHKPHFCVRCGAVEGMRPYFVDLGCESELIISNQDTGINHFTEGVLYLCSECISELFVQFNRKFWIYVDGAHQEKVASIETGSTTIKIQQDEIRELRKEIHRLKDQIAELIPQESTIVVEESDGAEDVLGKLLGEDNGTSGDTGTSDDSESGRGDSPSEGDDSFPDKISRNLTRDDEESSDEPPIITVGTLSGGG